MFLSLAGGCSRQGPASWELCLRWGSASEPAQLSPPDLADVPLVEAKWKPGQESQPLSPWRPALQGTQRDGSGVLVG